MNVFRYVIVMDGQRHSAFNNPSDALYYAESLYMREKSCATVAVFDTDDEDQEPMVTFRHTLWV